MRDGVVVVDAGVEPRAAPHGHVQLQFVALAAAGIGAGDDLVATAAVLGGVVGADAGDPVEELAQLLGRQLPLSVGADGAARLQGGGEGRVAPGDLFARGPVQVHGRSVRGGLHGGLGVDLAAVRVDGAEHVVVAPGADAGVEQQVVEVPLAQRRLRVGGERAVLVGGFDEAGAHEVGERVEGVVLAQAGAERAGRDGFAQGGDQFAGRSVHEHRAELHER